MTPSRYYLARFLLSFGFHRKQKRLMDAAGELHLLKEGEEVLGALCWRQAEELEEVSPEYWRLRKLDRECAEIVAKIREAEALLDKSHSERALVTDRSRDGQSARLDELAGLEREKEEVIAERDRVVEDAKRVKRSFEGLKFKIGVLEEEGEEESDSYREAQERMKSLRGQFGELKQAREEIATRMKGIEARLAALKKLLSDEEEGSQGETVESYTVIGRANRDLSKLRAEYSVKYEEAVGLQRDIGRHLAIHYEADATCGQAVREQLGLVRQLAFLRQSIQYNHRLAELS